MGPKIIHPRITSGKRDVPSGIAVVPSGQIVVPSGIFAFRISEIPR